jgi:hypothetical protein
MVENSVIPFGRPGTQQNRVHPLNTAPSVDWRADCGSPSILPIWHGYPGPEMEEKSRRHEILLVGCTLRNPRSHCNGCFTTGRRTPPPEGLPPWNAEAQ